LKKITNRKGILSILLCLSVLVALLVPAMPVSAANPEQALADWPLQIVGYTTVNLSATDLETMANAHPSNTYSVTGSTQSYLLRGVALWRLIALVDGGDSATFNESVYGKYSVFLHGINKTGTSYDKTINPSSGIYTGFTFHDSEDVFVANKYSTDGGTTWIDLPYLNPNDNTKLLFPTVITGTGISSSGNRVSGLVQIQLTNLPTPNVFIDPPSQSVANSANFNVNLKVNTDIASRGWQADVNFDAAKLTLNSVTEGTFLSAYATANGGGTFPVGAATINNTTGVATIPGWAISNAGTSGPTGTGTLAVLNFTAKASVNNYAAITPANVVVSDVLGATIPGTTITAGTVAIGTLPLPDLTVSNVVATGVGGALNTYNISFRVNNTGNLDAGASSASIVVDGGTPIVIAVPAIAAGANSGTLSTSTPITISGTNDSFVITADSTHVILESNESNNTANGLYSYVSVSGATTDVDGGLAGTLTFTQPGAVNFGLLNLGNNQVINPMNVLSNQSWTLNVHGNAPTITGGIDGKMTKWSSSPAPLGTYSATTKLHNVLHVVSGAGYMGTPADPTMTAPANYDVGLTGVDQLLCNGIPEGQNPDGIGGETRNAIFNQTIIGTDAALANGFTYHIVVSFTAATTAW
jgi:hypothetical protein